MDPEHIAYLGAGVAALLVGAVAKVFLDWQHIQPGSPRAMRGRLLFRHLYIAPDLVLLGLGLLLSSQALQAFFPQGNEAAIFGSWFTTMIYIDVLCLFFTLILWHTAGEHKYFPIADKPRTLTLPNGETIQTEVETTLWRKGLFKREGVLTIILGNFIGFGTVVGFGFLVFGVTTS